MWRLRNMAGGRLCERVDKWMDMAEKCLGESLLNGGKRWFAFGTLFILMITFCLALLGTLGSPF